MTVRLFSHHKVNAQMSGQQGFTLIELAMVLFIVGLVLISTLVPLTTQMEVRSIADTHRVMDQINEALVGFTQANGRLPCPASPLLQTGLDATAGTEQYTAPSCTVQVGVIPWATLGVPETDAWGRRFTYRVAPVFSDAIAQNTWNTTTPATQTAWLDCTTPTPTPTQSSFALCSLGAIAVLDRAITPITGVHTTSTVGSGLAAVFLSHGKNGYGAFQPNGVQVTGLIVNSDEATNALAANGTAGGGVLGNAPSGNTFQSYLFYSRTRTPASTGCSETVTNALFCEYDDIVYMISTPTLVSRMISAGRLP